MKYVITKASDENFIEVKEMTLEELNKLAFSQEIILRRNYLQGEYHIKELYNLSDEVFNDVFNLPMAILIYDDLVEC